MHTLSAQIKDMIDANAPLKKQLALALLFGSHSAKASVVPTHRSDIDLLVIFKPETVIDPLLQKLRDSAAEVGLRLDLSWYPSNTFQRLLEKGRDLPLWIEAFGTGCVLHQAEGYLDGVLPLLESSRIPASLPGTLEQRAAQVGQAKLDVLNSHRMVCLFTAWSSMVESGRKVGGFQDVEAWLESGAAGSEVAESWATLKRLRMEQKQDRVLKWAQVQQSEDASRALVQALAP